MNTQKIEWTLSTFLLNGFVKNLTNIRPGETL